MATVASWITESFGAQGTRHAFLVPGYLLGPLCEALAQSPSCRPIVCAHELGAAFAADGYARVSGAPGWCLGISAPGASNMLTGAIAARLDHQRVVYLIGDVPTANAGRSAFQDGGEPGSRDLALFRQAVAHAAKAESAPHAVSAFTRLLEDMYGLPPGPGFLSLPRDVQSGDISVATLPAFPKTPVCPSAPATLARLREAMCETRCLALLIGEMAARPGFAASLRGFAERYAIPVASTMPAKGLFPEDHELSLGCFGYGGSPRAREALLGSANDTVLALGVSLNERNTLQWDERLLTGRRVLRVQPWPSNERLPGVSEFIAEPQAALHALAESDGRWRESIAARRAWLEDLAAHPRAAPLVRPQNARGLHPAEIVDTMRRSLALGTRLFVDAGLGRRAVGQWWRCRTPDELYTSPVTAPMGWGIAASIGGQLACPDTPVVALAGDGSMLMHGMELVTAVRYQVPVIWVVNNNAALGTVWQRAPCAEAVALSLAPRLDWAAHAQLLGALGYRATTIGELGDALASARRAQRPAVIDVLGTLDFAPDDPLFGGTTHGQKAPA